MARPSSTYAALLRCTVCDTRLTIQRRRAKRREPGHTKHMYCYDCQAVTAWEELEG